MSIACKDNKISNRRDVYLMGVEPAMPKVLLDSNNPMVKHNTPDDIKHKELALASDCLQDFRHRVCKFVF